MSLPRPSRHVVPLLLLLAVVARAENPVSDLPVASPDRINITFVTSETERFPVSASAPEPRRAPPGSLAALAHRQPLPVVPLTPAPDAPPPASPSPVPKKLEDVPLPVQASDCLFARITRVGISVTKGSKAVMKYDVRLRAVDASVLAESDGEFVKLLSTSQSVVYANLKSRYRGGLNIPFLETLGIGLDKPISAEDVLEKERTQPNFPALVSAATRILVTTTEREIRIKGKLKAKGTSCVQTSVFAFIKLAEVALPNGVNRTVLTNDKEDLAAASRNGDVVLPSKGKLDVTEL